MKRTTLTHGAVFAIASWLLTAPASARQGETRLTDKAVATIIESVEKGRNTFESKIDDKVKSSILRSPRGELRVDAYLDDLEVNVKNLKSRFDKSYSASSAMRTARASRFRLSDEASELTFPSDSTPDLTTWLPAALQFSCSPPLSWRYPVSAISVRRIARACQYCL